MYLLCPSSGCLLNLHPLRYPDSSNLAHTSTYISMEDYDISTSVQFGSSSSVDALELGSLPFQKRSRAIGGVELDSFSSAISLLYTKYRLFTK